MHLLLSIVHNNKEETHDKLSKLQNKYTNSDDIHACTHTCVQQLNYFGVL